MAVGAIGREGRCGARGQEPADLNIEAPEDRPASGSTAGRRVPAAAIGGRRSRGRLAIPVLFRDRDVTGLIRTDFLIAGEVISDSAPPLTRFPGLSGCCVCYHLA